MPLIWYKHIRVIEILDTIDQTILMLLLRIFPKSHPLCKMNSVNQWFIKLISLAYGEDLSSSTYIIVTLICIRE